MGDSVSRSVAQRALQSSWILIAVLAIILTSCSGNGDIDGPVLTSPRSPLTGGGGFDAQIGGVLSYDENTGCLLLSNNPVIWPHGASWQADPPAVKLQGQTIEPDMSVLGSGGYHKYELIKESVGVIVADAAQACVGPTGEIAKFNHGTDVELVTNHGAAVADAAQACVGPTGEIAKFNHGSDVDLVTD